MLTDGTKFSQKLINIKIFNIKKLLILLFKLLNLKILNINKTMFDILKTNYNPSILTLSYDRIPYSYDAFIHKTKQFLKKKCNIIYSSTKIFN